jgi:hypothetical protein
VGWFVPDIEKAAAAFERLGFFLTPYVAHHNVDPVTGAAQPFGTANRCAMLRRGYLEILAAVAGADTELARQHRAAVARYTGLHLIAFSVADANAAHAHLERAGFDPGAPVNLRRPVRDANGAEATASFTVVRAPLHTMPEGRIQMLTHETTDLVWQPQLIAGDNGIAALSSVLLCVDDPGEAAARYGRFVGRKPESKYDSGFATVVLDRGSLAFATPARCGALLPGVRPLEAPAMVAVGLLADDVSAAHRFCLEHGIEVAFADERRFCVAPGAPAGAALLVHGDSGGWAADAD